MSSAAILAGGQARRFEGRDKGALLVADGNTPGRSILARQLEELCALTDDVLVVGYRGAGRYTGPRGPSHARVRLVTDRTPGCGPLGGLETALAEARDDVVAIIACDMPFVTRQLLGYLLALAGEADIVVPVTERGYHPLCAVYTRACLPVVIRHLRDGQFKMAALFDEVRVRSVIRQELEALGDPDRLLANINTRAEYDQLLAPDHQPSS
jgi:molybdopterin-guanine dinucleotide biosynthesis protein A